MTGQFIRPITLSNHRTNLAGFRADRKTPVGRSRMNTLLQPAHAQDQASSASGAFRMGIALGDGRCPETHPFCPLALKIRSTPVQECPQVVRI
jgi:hypothetical protein